MKLYNYLNEKKLSRQDIKEISQEIGEEAASDLVRLNVLSSRDERNAALWIATCAEKELKKL